MKNERIEELLRMCYKGVQDFSNSEFYKNYLLTMTKFHKYSMHNTLLIYLQKPSATYVAGYSDWKIKFGRYVKKGEKGIAIFAPIIYKRQDNDDDSEQILRGYKIVTVFDISQTEGKELPQLCKRLEGSVCNYKELFRRLSTLTDYRIKFVSFLGGANGACSYADKTIFILQDMSEVHTIKTLIHEIAHSLLHNNSSKSRIIKELEAESIAFSICTLLGIDTKEYSFQYLTAWGSLTDEKGFLTVLSDIKSVVSMIYSKLEEFSLVFS